MAEYIFNKKGYTLIELLVASIIIILISIGFMRGILFYIDYSLSQKMKDKATEVSRNFSQYIDKLSYNDSLISPTLNSYPNGWDLAKCSNNNTCTFENTDSDNDNIPDFYDPYNGSNDTFKSDSYNTVNWLRLKPQQSSDICSCDLGNCPSSLPYCKFSIKSDTNNPVFNIYMGITVARIVNDYNQEVGKAIGITVWYFDKINGKYKDIRTIIFKSNAL